MSEKRVFFSGGASWGGNHCGGETTSHPRSIKSTVPEGCCCGGFGGGKWEKGVDGKKYGACAHLIVGSVLRGSV